MSNSSSVQKILISYQVTAKIAENPIEYVLVNASGLNRRPSVPSSVKTGKNETVMTSREKKIDGATSCIASMISSTRRVPVASSSCSLDCSSLIWAHGGQTDRP